MKHDRPIRPGQANLITISFIFLVLSLSSIQIQIQGSRVAPFDQDSGYPVRSIVGIPFFGLHTAILRAGLIETNGPGISSPAEPPAGPVAFSTDRLTRAEFA